MLTVLTPSLEEKLFKAAEKGDLEEVQKILESKKLTVSSNKKENGWTVLHFAAKANQYDVADYLLEEQGVDVNVVTNMKQTPLHEACQRGFLPMVKLLIEHNANVNAKDVDSLTPLHKAAFGGHLDVVHFLVYKTNADVHARDKNGWTPFNLAATDFHEEVMAFLKRCMDKTPPPAPPSERIRTVQDNNNNKKKEQEDDDEPPPPPPPTSDDKEDNLERETFIPAIISNLFSTLDISDGEKNKYESKLSSNGYESVSKLKKLNPDSLHKMGIISSAHIQKILEGVRKL